MRDMFPFMGVLNENEGEGVSAVKIDGWDITTIVLYFVLVMGIGIYVSIPLAAAL